MRLGKRIVAGMRYALPILLTQVLLAGCATITRGTTEGFVVETDPPGAKARFSSGEQCITPCAIEKKRKSNFTIHITKPGYRPVEVTVVSQVAGAGAAGMAGNVIVGGIIGAGVDAASGATKELVPNPISITLEPLDTVAERGDRTCPGILPPRC